MKRSRIIATLALALALAACGGEGETTSPSPTASSVARPTSTGTISIDAPTTGQVVSTAGVTVKVSLVGATLAKQASTVLKADEGHVHLLVDGRTVTLLGTLEVDTGPLAPGPHLIEVEFAANDHGPFNPPVVARVTVRAG